MKICVSRLLVFTLILLSPLVAFAGPRYGILYSFPCSPVFSCPDGSDPSAGVIRDASGNLYGTTLLVAPILAVVPRSRYGVQPGASGAVGRPLDRDRAL